MAQKRADWGWNDEAAGDWEACGGGGTPAGAEAADDQRILWLLLRGAEHGRAKVQTERVERWGAATCPARPRTIRSCCSKAAPKLRSKPR